MSEHHYIVYFIGCYIAGTIAIPIYLFVASRWHTKYHPWEIGLGEGEPVAEPPDWIVNPKNRYAIEWGCVWFLSPVLVALLALLLVGCLFKLFARN